MEKNKTLYLWDLTGTIFYEKWNSDKTGFSSYDDWIENKTGKKIKNILIREYEEMYETPYKKGWYFNLDIMPGAKEVLEWTKNNEAFTAGVKKQINWRAEYLKSKIKFDILKYFKQINSSFDYSETNIKTKKMMIDYLNKKRNEGYNMVVYTDDKLKYCDAFAKAAEIIKKNNKNFSFRLYHILDNNSGLKKKNGYYEIGNLRDLLKNEKIICKNL